MVILWLFWQILRCRYDSWLARMMDFLYKFWETLLKFWWCDICWGLCWTNMFSYFILMLFCHTFFSLVNKWQVLLFGRCTWTYCDIIIWVNSESLIVTIRICTSESPSWSLEWDALIRMFKTAPQNSFVCADKYSLVSCWQKQEAYSVQGWVWPLYERENERHRHLFLYSSGLH